MRTFANRALHWIGTLSLAACGCFLSCTAVYPELKTPVRPVIHGQALNPPPPPELRWIAFRSGTIPNLTRGGQRWGNDLSKGLPDPYAKLLVNGAEMLRTNVDKATLSPTWKDSPKGNFRLKADDKLRVELWDARVINDHPVGVKEIGLLTAEQRALDLIEIELDSGARLTLANEAAHGYIGYGFYYELRTYDVYLTRVYDESPASRAGLRAGDLVVSINKRNTREMAEGEVQSLFNAPMAAGIDLVVQHEDGAKVSVNLKEGAVYPLFREIGAFE